jgi:hypothetical protein
MSGSVKQTFSRWAVLFCALFAGLCAGAFLGDPCRRLDRWGDIESHQAMLTSQTSDILLVKIQQTARPKVASIQTACYGRSNGDGAFMHSATDCMIGIRTDDAQERFAEFEAVSDSNLDLSVLIAQLHAVSRFKTAFVIRRLYIFQNQFNSIVEFSSLSMRQFGTSAREFGSIPSPRPLVLSTYTARALRSASAVRRSSQPPSGRMALLSEGETGSSLACWEAAGAGKTSSGGTTAGSLRGLVNGGSPKTT